MTQMENFGAGHRRRGGSTVVHALRKTGFENVLSEGIEGTCRWFLENQANLRQ